MAAPLTCPLCGFQFERADTLCHHGCPLATHCNLARCPVCEYEFPERLPSLGWMKRLFGRRGRPPRTVGGSAVGPATVASLEGGERAEIVCLAGNAARRNTLAVFGVVPGNEITLVQRRPSYVVQVGETLLALEGAVAADIVVRRT
jgi:Fe2+ transport system protein FeoA